MRIPPRIRIQSSATALLFALPRPLRRIIAGRPVRVDRQELALDAQLLLRLQQLSGTRLVQNGSVEESRAALDVSRHLVSGKPIPTVRTTEITIPTAEGDLPATLYTPENVPEPSGLLVFYHGGGWVLGSRTSHDNSVRFLAEHARVRVLSVAYRRAPEHPFPAAQQDALAAFEYAHAQASELGCSPNRIAVGGDSAGGNLAAVTAQIATRHGGAAPAFQLLFYPAIDATQRRRSRELFAEGFFLTEEDMTWFLDQYAPANVARDDPALSPGLAEDVSDLPPAYIATAGFDPLRDEGEEYAARLADAGVPVALSRQSDLIHGYINFIGVGTRSAQALAEAAGALRMGLQM